jgi:hypothetical protein
MCFVCLMIVSPKELYLLGHVAGGNANKVANA